MMKKKILHYLPVMIAAILLVACFLSVGIYDKTGVPFATVSISSEIPTAEEDELLGKKTILGIDLSVSLGGKVISADFPDQRSLEFFEQLSFVGKSLEDAMKIIAEDVPAKHNATAFIGVFASEGKKDTENLEENLKALVERAKNGYAKSALFTWGTYTDEAVRRAQSQKITLGRMAYALYFSEQSEEIGNYVDVYSVIESDPYDIAYYINTLSERPLMADTSRVKEYDRYMSEDEAKAIAVAGTRIWYGYTVEKLTFTGIAYYMGSLSYRFMPPEDETQYVFYVNMSSGEVLVGD